VYLTLLHTEFLIKMRRFRYTNWLILNIVDSILKLNINYYIWF